MVFTALIGLASVLGIVVFTVLAIVSAKKKNGSAKKNMIWAAACVVIFILAAALSPTNPKATTASKEQQQKQVAEEPKKEEPAQETSSTPSTPKIEDVVKKAITDSVKEKTNLKKDRLVELQVNDHAGTEKEGDKIVIAKMNANENLTNSLTRDGILLASSDAFKALFAIPEVEEAALFWQLPLVDVYGKTEDGVVLKITLTRAIAEKIQWDNFDIANYSKVASQYWEHPSFNK
ncbi:hypothetical protein [Brevibacillus borstelensis]